MSSALAIAAVTAVLRDLLSTGLSQHGVSGLVGGNVKVSVLPPDRVVSGTEEAQLNLFLHQVTPNQGWRNEGLPSREATGRQRLSNPPLALDLHYLLSAYTSADLDAEILLGYGMQLLHETPVLSRSAIQTALPTSPSPGATPPPSLLKLAEAGLENQIEQIKITPEFLSSEDLSKFWTATQSHLRPSAAYMASVVLIEAREPARSPLPVLTRGRIPTGSNREVGVQVLPGLQPAVPTLEGITFPGGQPVARIGDTIVLSGHHLDGEARTVQLSNDRLRIEGREIQAKPADASGNPGRIEFILNPGSTGVLPVGIYRVAAQMTRPQPTEGSEVQRTNTLALTLAPEITSMPASVARDGVGPDGTGTLKFTIQFQPTLMEGQEVELLLDTLPVVPEKFTAPTNSLSFVIEKAAAHPGHLVRLRIDGIESPVIDRQASPPRFLNKRLKVT